MSRYRAPQQPSWEPWQKFEMTGGRAWGVRGKCCCPTDPQCDIDPSRCNNERCECRCDGYCNVPVWNGLTFEEAQHVCTLSDMRAVNAYLESLGPKRDFGKIPS